jgi:MoaA/NifB/PqqE/SkfB family radical SAM enzyme
MDKIRIVNWLLTRKCNLECDYCAIVRNYSIMPLPYPKISHYIENEMSTKTVLDGLEAFKRHNPNAFHIFYGGEPLLRKDLPTIVNYCNEENIHYTIISNNTPKIQKLIDRLISDTDYIAGFTSSVDPVFNEIGADEDRIRKSVEGLKRLKIIQELGYAKDVVAEITVMNHNVHLLHQLVSELSQVGIYSDITFVDVSKNPYYDFSNVRDYGTLVYPSFEVASILYELMKDESLLIHMKDVLIPEMFNTLPSNMDCHLEQGVHNVSVDADGTLRLCLRIRGTVTPSEVHLSNMFDENDPTKLSDKVACSIKKDKKRLCHMCNHSCLIMSRHINDTEEGEDDLVHKDKREE